LAAILENPEILKSAFVLTCRDHFRHISTNLHQYPLKTATEDVFFVHKFMLDDGLLIGGHFGKIQKLKNPASFCPAGSPHVCLNHI
jgi:hypothetical protein